MGKLINIAGKVFGRLTVLRRSKKAGGVNWECLCSCGNTVIVGSQNLRNGHAKSCGCLKKDLFIERITKHGCAANLLYRNLYLNMVGRCINPNNVSYKNYGAKGITVYQRWLNDPTFFVKWALLNGYAEGMQLHRKDKNRGYYPSNCEFIDRKEHIRKHRGSLNESDIKYIQKQHPSFLGTFPEYCHKMATRFGVHYDTIRRIIKKEGRYRNV